MPSIATSTEYIEVTDVEGKQNHIILMTIPQSMRVHANQADEDFMVTLWRKEGSGTVQNDPESLPNSKESARSWQGVGKELGVDYRVLERIGDFCQEARSLSEIAEHLGLGDRYKMKKKYIDPILGKYIEMLCTATQN